MRKGDRRSLDTAILDIWKREVGELSIRNFAHRFAASQDLVLRFDLLRKLDKHRGCVNTISFNADGDILVSGSDDLRIIFWDWEVGHAKISFHSGHSNNVFQAKIMPYTEDRSIVTCAADGQVRHAHIKEYGQVETKLLAKHRGRAHKLAIEPGSPHIFYTCGEDGLVQHFDLRSGAATELFTCKPIRDISYLPVVLLNAIAIDPRNPNFLAVAGSDEYARLYDIRKCNWDGSTDFGQPVDFFCPPHLIGGGGITGLAFSDQSELLVSYIDESIYLFTRDMGLGPDRVMASSVSMDSDAGEMKSDDQTEASPSDKDDDFKVGPQVYKGHRNCETVKGVNFFGPKCEYVVSGSDCGRIFIWNKWGGELVRVMEADKHVVNCIESHPHTTVLASSGIENDIKIWTPKAIERATLPTNIEMGFMPDRIRFISIDDFDDVDYYDDEEGEDMDDDDDDEAGDDSCSDLSEDYCDEDDNDGSGYNSSIDVDNDDYDDAFDKVDDDEYDDIDDDVDYNGGNEEFCDDVGDGYDDALNEADGDGCDDMDNKKDDGGNNDYDK